MKKAKKAYENFHGRDPRRVSEINFDVPSAMIKLGRAVAIEYECNKLNGGGDGKKAVYRHKFGRGVSLLMDEKQSRQLYIIGDRVIVTDAGIEH